MSARPFAPASRAGRRRAAGRGAARPGQPAGSARRGRGLRSAARSGAAGERHAQQRTGISRRGLRSAARSGAARRRGSAGRGERGEALALLVVWPALITAILLMLVHAFIVTNAQAEAELAASQGLRAAWRAAADSDFVTVPVPDPNNPTQTVRQLHIEPDPNPAVLAMAEAAKDAAARAAATEGGWRWWTPGVAEVQSDWCRPYEDPADPSYDPDMHRPAPGQTGWVRVVVSGEVYGPLAALWPNRWDRVYAVAQGPALLVPPGPPDPNAPDARPFTVPAALETC